MHLNWQKKLIFHCCFRLFLQNETFLASQSTDPPSETEMSMKKCHCAKISSKMNSRRISRVMFDCMHACDCGVCVFLGFFLLACECLRLCDEISESCGEFWGGGGHSWERLQAAGMLSSLLLFFHPQTWKHVISCVESCSCSPVMCGKGGLCVWVRERERVCIQSCLSYLWGQLGWKNVSVCCPDWPP